MRFHLSALTAAVMTATTVLAQAADSTSPIMLDQVTISATRTERELKDVASSVSVQTAADVENKMHQNIRDLVKYEPGVDVTSDSRFGLGSFNIRGMDENRVKITVDGVDQAKSFGYDKFIQSQRNFFDIENMKQVEIVKGPASTLHGSDAIGGVVAFITKDPADYLNEQGDDSFGSVKGGYTSADSGLHKTMTLANRTGDLESMLVLTQRGGDERETFSHRTIYGEGRGAADPGSYDSNSLLGKIQYQINDQHRIGVTGEWQDGESENETLSLKNDTLGSTTYNSSRADDASERKRLGIFHEWSARTIAFDEMRWTLNWQKSKSHQKTYDDVNVKETSWELVPFPKPTTSLVHYERLKDYTYEETSVQFDATLNKYFSLADTDHLLTYGVSYEDREQNNLNKTHTLVAGTISGPGTPSNPVGVKTTRYAPVASTSQSSMFVQDEFSLLNNRLILTPGLRYDRFEVSSKSDQYYKKEVKDHSYDSWTTRIGAVYEINDTWSTFAQYSQGFSTPDLFAMYFEELPYGAPVHVMPNPNLEPEKSDSWELGLRASNHLGSMEITAFYNDYTNFIEQIQLKGINDGDGRPMHFQYQNLSKATIEGIEFKGQLLLDEAFNAPGGTRFNAAIAMSRGRGDVVSDYKLYTDEPLNSVAPLKAVLALGYDAPSGVWGSELTWTLVASKKKKDISNLDKEADLGSTNATGNQFATSGYGLVDLSGYYKPRKDVTITAGLFNALDKKYRHWNDVRGLTENYAGLDRYTQPGRNFSVSVKWDFM